jgi:hypothetical protein
MFSGAAAIWAVNYWVQVSAAIEGFRADGDMHHGSLGVGVYVALGAALLFFATSWWARSD